MDGEFLLQVNSPIPNLHLDISQLSVLVLRQLLWVRFSSLATLILTLIAEDPVRCLENFFCEAE